MKFVLLAAGKSSRIYNKIKKPKCLLEINGKTLIEKIIFDIRGLSASKIYIVLGFKANMIKKRIRNFSNIKFIINQEYNSKDMLHSFILGLKRVNDDIVFSYTDIIFEKKLLKSIISKKNNIYLPVLKNWKQVWRQRKKNFYKDAEDLKIDKSNFLLKIGDKIKKNSNVKYQYMGIFMVPKEQRLKIISLYNKIKTDKLHITNFFNIIIKEGVKIKCLKTSYKWYEFDDWQDYKNY